MTEVFRVRDDCARIFTYDTAPVAIRSYLNGVQVYLIDSYLRSDPLLSANYMFDTIHPRRTFSDGYRIKGLYPPGQCFHVTVDLTNWPSVRDYSLGPYNVVFDSTALFRPAPYTTDWMATIVPTSGTRNVVDYFNQQIPQNVVDSLSEQAWNYFSDVLPAHLSFSEFVQGFTQLKDLLPSVGDSIAKTISGGYLTKKFGWDNLLSDLNTCAGLVQTVLDRMDYFRRTYGIPQRLGFVRHVPVDDPPYSGSRIPVFDGNYEMVSTVQNFRCTFRSTAWIIQTLDLMDGLCGFLRIFVGALGLNNPVKAFWQTLPLSFVVDWFFNISQHLDNLTRLNPATGWDVRDVTQSLSYEYDTKIDFNYHGGSGFTNISSGVIHTKVYDRRVGLSFSWELLNPEELSTTQLTLFLSMLHQYA